MSNIIRPTSYIHYSENEKLFLSFVFLTISIILYKVIIPTKSKYKSPNKNLPKIGTLIDQQGRDCILPQGGIMVWKACQGDGYRPANLYVELFVPHSAKRVTPLYNNPEYKSRVEYAIVRSIKDSYGCNYDNAYSFVYQSGRHFLEYVVGQKVVPSYYDNSKNKTCAAGINVHRYRDHCNHWFKY